ncbi:MAG: hypothetical protein U0941_24595 [Planctomycetaceae bacterium]
MSEPAASSVKSDSGSIHPGTVRLLFLVLIVFLGFSVRWLASCDNFWFDEVWSWNLATEANSYWEIATAIRHDNNHVLNSWLIHALPPNVHWSFYRLPAVVAGTVAVALAGFSGFRRSTTDGLIASLLMSTSFVMIQYSSEARGYAYLQLFLVLCIWCMGNLDRQSRPSQELLFSISSSLGFLAHISFASAYVGFVCWSIVTLFKQHASRARWVASLVRLHALPVLTLAWLLYYNARHLVIGGGNQNPLFAILVQAASLVIGGPDMGALAVVCTVATVMAAFSGTVLLIRRQDGLGLFIAGSSLTLTAVVGIARPDVIYVRYFLVIITAALLAISHLLATLWMAGGWQRVVSVVAVILILAGNAVHVKDLLIVGRGGYEAAVTLMNEASQTAITVGSDHDFRNPMLLKFYHQRIDSSKPMTYFKNGQWPATGPEWVILHTFDRERIAQPSIQDGGGNTYHMIRDYPYAGLSGWRWVLYRNEQRPSAVPPSGTPQNSPSQNSGQSR